jgi:hypothetical protein
MQLALMDSPPRSFAISAMCVYEIEYRKHHLTHDIMTSPE